MREWINRLICKYKGHSWMSYPAREDDLGCVELVRCCMRCGITTSKWTVADKIEPKNTIG